jgi:hypothetical protein
MAINSRALSRIYLKGKVKNAVEYVCCFQEVMVREACARGFDGAVCGHSPCRDKKYGWYSLSE